MTGKRWAILLAIGFVFMFSGISGAEAEHIHRVEDGENLSRIAADYDTDVDKLMKLNPFMEEPDRIFTGQALVIPDIEEPTEEQQTVDKEQELDDKQVLVKEEVNEQASGQANELKTAQTVEASSRLTTAQLMQYYRSSFLYTGPRDTKRSP